MSVEQDVSQALSQFYDRTPEDEAPDWFKAMQWEPKVGDRVRVLVAAECDLAVAYPESKGHDPKEVGLTGTVVPMPPGYQREGWLGTHPYAVRYDNGGARLRGRWCWGGAFAAIELEPLPDDPPAEGTER